MTLDRSIAKDHSSLRPSVCPFIYYHSEPCLNRSGYYNTCHGGGFSFMTAKVKAVVMSLPLDPE